MTMRTPRAVGILGLLLLAPPFLARAVSATSAKVRGPAAEESRGLTVTVTGEVVDERGSPVAGAEVEAFWMTFRPRRVRVNAGGRFAVPGLHEGQPYVLRASHRGFAPESLAITPIGTMTGYRLTLRSGATASGTVVDETGHPVAGARVELFENEVYPHPYRSISRPDGSFRISDLPAAVFELQVVYRGVPLLSQSGIEISREARTDLGRLALPAGKRFQGKALDPQGHPLAGARVLAISMGDPAFRWGANSNYGLEPAAVTGPDGGFEIARLAPATSLFFCLPGYQTSRVADTSPPPEPRRIVLTPDPPRPRISGRVLDETGRPIAGARISPGDPGDVWAARAQRWSEDPCHKADPLEETTDAAGRFAFDLLEPGKPELRVRAPGYLLETRKVPQGRTATGIDIVLHRGATVAGRVFAADGSPAAGARVYATQEGGAAETVTDAQGRYRLEAVEPGWRELWADHPDLGEARRRLELASGTRRLDLNLDGRGEPAIAGRVVGPDGEPLAGVRVQHGDFSTFETGEDGGFRIVQARGHLLFGDETENLVLGREGYATLLYPFKSSSLPIKGLEIRMEKSRDLTGRILGVEPAELARASIEASRKDDVHRGRIEPDGAFRFTDLGSGTWSVLASLGSRMAKRDVELGPEGASLDLELPPLAQVRGVVLAPDGGAVSGAIIRFANPALEADSLRGSTRSEDDGTFSIEIPEGRYEVSAIANAYAPTALEAPLVVADRPIDDLEIRLKPGLTLRGRILGMPEGASGRLTFSQGDQKLWVDLGPDGTYRCIGLGPGEWRVDASINWADLYRERQTQVTLAPGAPEAVFDIDLPVGDLTLAGRLTSGEEPLSTTVTLLLPDGQRLSEDVIVEDTNGAAFHFPGLRAGRYLLRVQDYYRDRRTDVPVDLTSDRTMTIDLLRPGS